MFFNELSTVSDIVEKRSIMYSESIYETTTNVGVVQYISCNRRYQCVSIRGNSHVNVTSAGTYTLTITIPDNYKPGFNVWGAVTMVSGRNHSNARVYIFTTGVIQYFISATGEYEFYWTITYLL